MGPVETELRSLTGSVGDWFERELLDDTEDTLQSASKLLGVSMDLAGWRERFPEVVSEAIEAAEALGV